MPDRRKNRKKKRDAVRQNAAGHPVKIFWLGENFLIVGIVILDPQTVDLAYQARLRGMIIKQTLFL